MHLDLSHGKWLVEWNGGKVGVVEPSWIQPLYCLQHTAHFPLVNPSELDLSKDSVEDRYLNLGRTVPELDLIYFSIPGQIYCKIHQTPQIQ